MSGYVRGKRLLCGPHGKVALRKCHPGGEPAESPTRSRSLTDSASSLPSSNSAFQAAPLREDFSRIFGQ